MKRCSYVGIARTAFIFSPDRGVMSTALQSWKVRGVEVPNRIVVPPMCTWLADPLTNEANDRHFVHYGGFAMGGSGLIIIESTPVEYRGRFEPRDMCLYNDSQIAPLKRLNNSIHDHSKAKTAIQLGHAGRMGTCINCMSPAPTHLRPEDRYGSECIGPSPISYDIFHHSPKEMDADDLQAVKNAFVSATRRAVRAGFDMIEVHSAYGLLSNFTSPLSNQRTDQYGGSLENRLRYPLEVMQAVRASMPETMPLIVRICATEWVPGGFDVEDAVIYARMMKQIGVDIVHVSSGGNNKDEKGPSVPQFQIPLSEKIRREANVHTIAVGMVEKLVDASAIIEDGKADLVAVGRSHLKDPYWLRNEAASLRVPTWFPMYQVAGYASLRKLYTGQDDEELLKVTPEAVQRAIAGMEVSL